MVYRLATIIHSHLSHVQNIFLHFQDPPEVSSHCGSRLRLKVKDLSSKSGLGTKEDPRNQFLECSSLSVILSDLPDAHPRHHRRTGPLNAFPSVGEGEAHRYMAVLDSSQVRTARSCSAFLCGSCFYSLDSWFCSFSHFPITKSQHLQLGSFFTHLPAYESLGIRRPFSFCIISVSFILAR